MNKFMRLYHAVPWKNRFPSFVLSALIGAVVICIVGFGLKIILPAQATEAGKESAPISIPTNTNSNCNVQNSQNVTVNCLQKNNPSNRTEHLYKKPPIFEAKKGGIIYIPNFKANGDIGSIGQFADVESGSLFYATNLTLNIEHPPSVPFPDPTGEFSNLSNIDLRKRLEDIANRLRDLQVELNNEQHKTYNLLNSETLNEYDQFFKKLYAHLSVSLASEAVARIHTVETTTSTYKGGQVILQGTITGNDSLAFAAEFLDSLSKNLPTS